MPTYDRCPRPASRSLPERGRRRAAARNKFGLAQFGDFECCHCQLRVSADPLFSGVNNRNHCPYCLWSRHVDLRVPGDRLCACRGPMRPVGLTFKRIYKKYAPAHCANGAGPGELMLVHHCDGLAYAGPCGAFSINRLAADDCPASLGDVFEASLAQPALAALAARDGIDVLGPAERTLVRFRLFGTEDDPIEVCAALPL